MQAGRGRVPAALCFGVREAAASGELFDAIVVGGGPAGSLSALHLARLGWSVVLIERRERGRGKACGHCLSPRALAALAEIGAQDAVERGAAGALDRLRVHTPGAAPIEFPLGSSRASGLLIDRGTFDQLLMDLAARAGAQLMQPATARGMQMGRRMVTVHVTNCDSARVLRAPLLIGADGLRSNVARAAGVRSTTSGRKFGFSFDLTRATPPPSGAIDMFVVPGAYLGAVAQQRGSVHIAAMIGWASAPREPMQFCRFMARCFKPLASLGLANAPPRMMNLIAAGPMPCRPRTIAGRSFALVGDAAGYIEPFTGEGMLWGLESARALAEVAANVRPGRWNDTSAARYARLWSQRIGAAQRRCAVISWTLERNWALAAARWFAGHQPGLAQAIVNRTIAA